MRMRYLTERVLALIVVLVGVSILTYGLIGLTPGDPARTALTQEYGGDVPPPSVVEEFREQKGLDDPLYLQYFHWLSDAVRGDLGESYETGRPVSKMILEQMPATVTLAVTSVLVGLVVAVPLGVVSAIKNGTIVDSIGRLFALFGLSMPNFWFGYLLIIAFALEMGLFPVSGTGRISHLVLPVATLSLGTAAMITRLVRTSILDVLSEKYILTAKSKGLREQVVVYRHALKSALAPVITVVGLQFGYVLNGAVVVEVVFQRPGLGTLLVDALFARDYPLVLGVTLFTAVTFVVTNFLVDICYGWIDPRVEMEGGMV